MIRQLHHVCILTDDVDALAARLQATLGLPAPPTPRLVSNEGTELRTTMLPIGNGTYLQLLEPHRGPGVAELEHGGEGALFEVAFEVRAADRAAEEVRGRGLTPVDLSGQPLAEGYATAGSGSRYLYLPRHMTAGVRVELIEPAARSGAPDAGRAQA
jgi:catechol 2,3-dioxygenase-like lactoylglutathione lyase family enzyme